MSTVSEEKKLMLPVYAMNGDQVGEVEVSGEFFAATVAPKLMHDAVLAYLANQRQGNAATKERGEVAGSTRKLFRQKGTGRARAGSRRSPTRVGGGVAFGPHPRDYRQRLPKKVRRQALCGALTSRATSGEIRVLDSLTLDRISTKTVAEMLKALGLTDDTLLVTGKPDDTLMKSARNIEKLQLARAEDLNTYEVLFHHTLLFTREGLSRIQEVLA